MLAVVRFVLFFLPVALGTRIVISLAGVRLKYRMKDEEAKWLERVERISYGKGKVAWRTGEGPLVVLLHGYGGCAAQLYKIADMLVKEGFSVVAPDITSHGHSDGEKIMFRDFIDDVAILRDHLGEEVYAYVGHSAGGMCMMAGRRIHGLQAKKYICITTPSYPYPPIRAVQRRLNPPASVLEGYKGFIASQFEGKWGELDRQIYDYLPEDNLLLIYDNKDRFLLPGDLEAIQAYWPSAQKLITQEAGHEGVLRDKVCLETILSFLKS